ncbi:MAG: hypothetical protein A2V83_09050 [Nitrospirae bacterium RBG_16_64_22]|nr:MAG: hypothetical protein A2V83_09050 [Nitrospirae bacterium RBG_16_64_22]
MDLISLPIISDNPEIDTRFRMVILASHRVRDLADGQTPLVPPRSRKLSTIALDEAAQGKLICLVGEKARHAIDESRKRRALAAAAEGESDLAELEKDLKIYIHDRQAAGMIEISGPQQGEGAAAQTAPESGAESDEA